MSAADAAACGMPWPVCPYCLGQGLSLRSGTATCPSCTRSWPVGDVAPCPWPASDVISDAAERTAHVCRSHASHPSPGDLTRMEPSEDDDED